jgi:hypothetical protein
VFLVVIKKIKIRRGKRKKHHFKRGKIIEPIINHNNNYINIMIIIIK